MKVLKSGTGQNGWSTSAVCTGKGNGDGGCGAKLMVEENDLYITSAHCGYDTENFITFRCVECGVETDIKDVPSQIWTKIRNRVKNNE